MKTTTNILIKNVTEENQYKGSYKRIFNILNKKEKLPKKYLNI